MSCCNNFEGNPSQPLICNNPCPCTKCRNKRTHEEGCEKMTEEESVAHNKFLIFVTEVISFLAFLMFTIIVIWISISKYAFNLAVKIYKADKNTKVAIAIMIGLLTLSVTLNLVILKTKRMMSRSGGCGGSKTMPPSKRGYFSGIFGGSKGKNKITVTPKNPGDKMWNKPAKFTDKDMQNKNITVTITDSRAREIFRQSKIFAVPTEMKRPPAMLVYLHNVILKNY